MDVNDLLARAWAAVEASGVPESLQPVAFKEAVLFLRGDAPTDAPEQTQRKPPPRGKIDKADRTRTRADSEAGSATPDAFFERLARESGVAEKDLRDILQLTRDSKVHVSPPTKDLGSSVAEQARTVIVLVAGARGIGLDENPVRADAVRDELSRKRCYSADNFAAKHLGPLKGFNAGANRTEIVLASKWVDDFKAAADRVHGRPGEQ